MNKYQKIKSFKFFGWHIMSGFIDRHYTAWCKKEPFLHKNPLYEFLTGDIYFNFGKTRISAIYNLLKNDILPIEKRKLKMNDTVSIDAKVLRDTPKESAILFQVSKLGIKEPASEWIPRSEIISVDPVDASGNVEVIMNEWIALEKGLV